jgi:general secretion pathway protein K
MSNHVTARSLAFRRSERGIALILVLWVVMLLAVIAGSFSYSVRTNVTVANNLVSQARVRALADAGIQRGLYELTKPESDGDRWLASGFSYSFNMDTVEVSVVMRDESGKIDLNTANDVLLKGLFLSIGLTDDQTIALLDAILDWRDVDELVRPFGAEHERYKAEGFSYSPSNVAFESVEELRRVIGMTAEIYQKVEGAITVHSKQTGFNSSVAERNVLKSLPNVTDEDIDAYLAEREKLLADGKRPLPFPLASAFDFAGSTGVYNLQSVAVGLDGVRFQREATVRIMVNNKQPFVVLRWTEPHHLTHSQTKEINAKPFVNTQ